MLKHGKKNKAKTELQIFAQLLLIIFLVVIITLIGKNIYFNVQKERDLNAEIQAIKQEAERVEQKNQSLNKLIQYLESESAQEREIKNKLNLAKEGEKVVFIQGEFEKESDNNQEKNQKNKVIIKKPNYYYWWHYFFNKD